MLGTLESKFEQHLSHRKYDLPKTPRLDSSNEESELDVGDDDDTRS